MNLHSAFVRSASQRGENPAVFWGDDVISYQRLHGLARALAATLRSEFGAQPGDRVAIWVKNCPEFPALVFGAWEAGGVVVMVNNFLKPDEGAYIVRDSGAV